MDQDEDILDRKNEVLDIHSDDSNEKDEKDELNELIVSNLPTDFFTNDLKKSQLEKLFKYYANDNDNDCTIIYLNTFKRCIIKYKSEIYAIKAQYDLDNYLFENDINLKVFFRQKIKLKNARKFLEPPANEKTFLISPPSSPPVGWEQQLEDPPVVDYNLLAAITKLEPFVPCELVKESEDNLHPGIILHPCEDHIFEENDNSSHMARKFIPTRRPANDMS